MKLKEDTVMLRCRMAWDDVDWSRSCTFALREKIYHLNMLIQSLKKKETTEDMRCLGEELETLAPRLHDLLKPLLESYLLRKSKQKNEQTESCMIHIPAVLPADGVSEKKLESSTSGHDEKVEQKECINIMKGIKRKKLEGKKLNQSQQDSIKLPRLQEKRVPKSAHVTSRGRISIKTEPPDPMGKALLVSTFIEKDGSRENDERKDTDKEVIDKSKTTQVKLETTNLHFESRESDRKIAEIVKPADEVLVMDCEKQTTRASIKIQKARTYNGAIHKKALVPKKSLVKIEKKPKKSPETTEALFNHRTKHASRAKMNLDHKIQEQQRHEIKTFKINKAEEIDTESSSVENLTGQKKIGVPKKMSKNEPQQVLDGEFKVELDSTRKKKKMESSETENDPSDDGMADEPGAGEKLLLSITDVERLKLNDLKIIAKNQKLPGYYRLRKKELQERLGLEGPMKKASEKKGVLFANTI